MKIRIQSILHLIDFALSFLGTLMITEYFIKMLNMIRQYGKKYTFRNT